LEHEVSHLQAISDKYDPIIARHQAIVSELTLKAEQLGIQLPTIIELSDPADDKKEQKKSDARKQGKPTPKTKDAVDDSMEVELTESYLEHTGKLSKAVGEKNVAISKINSLASDKFDFFFNLQLAQATTPDNYTTPDTIPLTKLTPLASEIKGEKQHGKKSLIKLGPGPVIVLPDYTTTFKDDVTDCFGDVLVDQSIYTLIVLSCYAGPEQNATQFTNNWTGWSKIPLVQFMYRDPNLVDTLNQQS
jgi:hypothetical protein